MNIQGNNICIRFLSTLSSDVRRILHGVGVLRYPVRYPGEPSMACNALISIRLPTGALSILPEQANTSDKHSVGKDKHSKGLNREDN